MPRLDGKTAVVAALAAPLAEAVALRIGDEGANVVVAAPESVTLSLPERIRCTAIDATDESAWAEFYREVREREGRVDVVANIAGEPAAKPLADTSLDEFRGAALPTIDFVFASSRAAILAMRDGLAKDDTAAGSLINVSSFAANVGLRRGAMLNATAAGIWNLSRQLGIELGENGELIRSNCVLIGPDRDQAIALGIDPAYAFDKPDDLADAIVYLASDAARLVTAAEITIDRGLSAGL